MNTHKKKNKKPGAISAGAAAHAAGADTTKLATSQRHLLVVAIGPVLKFIGAARRMRDLAFGSRLLSDLAAELAATLCAKHQAQLVFPAAASPLAPDADASNAVAARSTNKIVCLLPLKQQPADVAKALKAELKHALERQGSDCLANLTSYPGAVLEAEFMAQIADSLQLYCAWSQVRGDSPKDYSEAYHQAQKLLDARKRLRDFNMPPMARAGWLLSSLDGERDSVLADGHLPFLSARPAGDEAAEARKQAGRLRDRYQVDSTEQLDAMGLVKRTLGTEAGFPAITRVALQPWVAQWKREPEQKRLRALSDTLQKLAVHGLSRRQSVNDRPDDPLADLPFDGELLLAPRRALARRQALAKPEGQERRSVLSLIDELDNLLAGEPALSGSSEGVYVAVLAADGDHMGKVILSESAKQAPPAQLHRRIALALKDIADNAVLTVRQHGGCTLYAGGDDLLAILPVDTALACAEALRSTYAATLGAVLPEALRIEPTLSIGIGVGHVIEPMGRLLAQAADACQLAKDGLDGQGLRNALCLAVKPRGGIQARLVRKWDSAASNAAAMQPVVDRLLRWRAAFAARTVSGSLPYDLMRAVENEPRDALSAASCRLFGRRGIQALDLLADVEQHWQHALRNNQPIASAARELADEWYLCRWLAAHPQPAVPGGDQAPGTATSAASNLASAA